ncbi:MAG: glycosyltransferase family 9 protein [Candidatus Liptonbacteria bacterium]|nr:glycosyltransferase family 9 protein [Candidatus Liptonbacteria bacterium]
MLIINLEAMGDLVIFTSVLKHYKKKFPNIKIFLLINDGMGMEKVFKNFVDEVLTIQYKKFAVDPFYGFKFINKLRRIGFSKVINHDFTVPEIIGKIIAVGVGAKEIIGHEGQEMEFQKPHDVQQKKQLKFIKEKILPRYTKLIPSIHEDMGKEGTLASILQQYVAIYEATTGFKEEDYATILPGFDSDRQTKAVTQKFGLKPKSYAVLNINCNAPCRTWPAERFLKIAEFLAGEGFDIALVGSGGEFARVKEFQENCGAPTKNLAGETSFREMTALVKHCALVVANDTSTIHVAIALKKPSLGISGGGKFGLSVLYGYKDINMWVYKRTECYNDNWHCAFSVPYNMSSPCVAAVTTEMVLEKLKSLVAYLRQTDSYPREKFRARF